MARRDKLNLECRFRNSCSELGCDENRDIGFGLLRFMLNLGEISGVERQRHHPLDSNRDP